MVRRRIAGRIVMAEKEVVELWKTALETKREFAKKLQAKPYDLAEDACYLEHADFVPLIRFRAFEEFSYVNAAFSTRFGGVSVGHLAMLNLGFGRGDSEETVSENYRLFCQSMGVDSKNLVLSDQVHGTKIYTAGKDDICREAIRKKLRGIDGLMTDQPEVCLATSYADCVPLFFFDPVKRVVASSHSGWRGTVMKMGAETAAAMEKEFGSKKENLVAVIGPSICQACYEVGGDVISEFRKHYDKGQMEEIAYCSNEETGKYQLDLWAANFLQLREAGLLAEHIHVSGICTCCNSRLLFSHRASKGKRGNLNGFISLCHSSIY